MGIECVTVDLDEVQMAEITPISDKLSAESPGMLLAQIFDGKMKVFYATPEQAQEIQRAMGSPVGMMASGSGHRLPS